MPSLIASSKGFKGSLMFLSNRRRTIAMVLPSLKIKYILGPIYMGLGDPRWVREPVQVAMGTKVKLPSLGALSEEY